MASDGGGGGGGSISVIVTTIPTPTSQSSSDITTKRRRLSQIKLVGVGREDRCCGHWFPSIKTYHRHLAEKAHSDPAHEMKLLELGMLRCLHCSLWVHVDGMNAHLRKSHGIIKVNKTGKIVSNKTTDEVTTVSGNSGATGPNFVIKVSGHNSENNCIGDIVNSSTKSLSKTSTVKLVATPSSTLYHKIKNLQQTNSSGTGKVIVHKSMPKTLPFVNVGPRLVMKSLGPTSVVTLGSNCKILPQSSQTISASVNGVSTIKLSAASDTTVKFTGDETSAAKALSSQNNTQNVSKKKNKVVKKVNNLKSKAKSNEESQTKSNESSTQVPASRTEASLDLELVEKGQICISGEDIPVSKPKPVKKRRKQILKPTETELSVVNEPPDSLAMKVKKRGRKPKLTPEGEVSRSSSVNKKAHRQKLKDCLDGENYTPKTGRQTSRGASIRGRWNKRKRGPGRPRKVRTDDTPDLSDIDSLFDEAENENLENEPVVVAKTEEENIPTVELDLFTLPSLNEQMSVLLTEPKNPNFKVYASMDAIFVGDSALGDVTNQIGYVTDANNVVFVNPGHFLFPNVEDLENFVPSPILTMKGNKSSITPVRQVWKLNVNKAQKIQKESKSVSTKSFKYSSTCDLNIARVSSENTCDLSVAKVSSENTESQVPVRQRGNERILKPSQNECNTENSVISTPDSVDITKKSELCKETVSVTVNTTTETVNSMGENFKDISVKGNSQSPKKHFDKVKKSRRRSKSRSSSSSQELLSDNPVQGENSPLSPTETVSKPAILCASDNSASIGPNNKTVDPGVKSVGDDEIKINITDDKENKRSENETVDITNDLEDKGEENENVDAVNESENIRSENEAVDIKDKNEKIGPENEAVVDIKDKNEKIGSENEAVDIKDKNEKIGSESEAVDIKDNNDKIGSENDCVVMPVTDDNNRGPENENIDITDNGENKKSESENGFKDICYSESMGSDNATVDLHSDSDNKDSENADVVRQQVKRITCSSTERLKILTVSKDLSKGTLYQIQKSVPPRRSSSEITATLSHVESGDLVTQEVSKNSPLNSIMVSKPSPEKTGASVKEKTSKELVEVQTSNETSKVIVMTNVGYPRRQRRRRLRSKSAIIVCRSVVDHSQKPGHNSGSRLNCKLSEGRSRHLSESSAVNYKGDISRHNFREKLKWTSESKQPDDKAEMSPVRAVENETVEQVSYPHTPQAPQASVADMDNSKKTHSLVSKEVTSSLSHVHDSPTVKQEKKRKRKKRALSETLDIMPLKREESANTMVAKTVSDTNEEDTSGLRSVRERRPSYRLLESLAVAKQSPRRNALPRIEKEACTVSDLERNVEDVEDIPVICKKTSVSGNVSPELSIDSQSSSKGRKKLKCVKSEEPFSVSSADINLSPREWHGRGAKLKAQVLIQDQQAGVTDSHVFPSCDISKQLENAVNVSDAATSTSTALTPISSDPQGRADRSSQSMASMSTPLSPKTCKSPKSPTSLQNREWQARGAKLKAQVMISDPHSSVVEYSEAEVASPVIVSPPAKKIKIEKSPGSMRDIRSFFALQKSRPQKLKENSTALFSPHPSSEHVIHKVKTPKAKRVYHQKCDIRAFFDESTASSKRKYTSTPKSDIPCSPQNLPRKEKLEAVNVPIDFEGFERCSRQSGIRARSLMRLVSLLNMKRWYHLGKLPFPLDQLCVWNDELLNAKVFTENN